MRDHRDCSVFRATGAALAFVLSAALAKAADCDAIELKITTTPSLPLRASSLRTHLAATRQLRSPVKAIMIGDSIAKLWPNDQLIELFGETVVNLGIEGDRTQNVLLRLDAPQLATLDLDRAMLVVGTNNLAMRNKPCAIAAGIEQILEKMHALWPRARITIMEILPRGKQPAVFQAERREVNALIEQLARKHNFASALQVDDFCADPNACPNFLSDLTHPSEEGYVLLSHRLKSSK